MENLKKTNISIETAVAIFIVIFGSVLSLTNIFLGFNIFAFLLFSIIGFLLSIVYPRSGIYATLFLTIIFERFFTLQPLFLGRNEYKIYPLDILVGGVILGLIFYLIKKKEKLALNKIDCLVIAFLSLTFFYLILGFFDSEADFSLAFSSFKNYFFYGLLYFPLSLLFNEKKNKKRLFEFFFAGAIGVIFYFLFGIFRGEGLWIEYTPLSTEGTRLLAFTHAFYVSMAIVGLLVYLSIREKIRKFHYFLLIIWLLAVAGSMMRHLWLGILFALILMIIFLGHQNRKNILKVFSKTILASFILTFFIALFVAVFPTSSFSRFSENATAVVSKRFETLVKSSYDDSFSWRESAWKSALESVNENFLLGLGLGKKIGVDEEYNRGFIEIRNIHNSILVILVQFGLIGFLIFFLIVFYLLKNVWIFAKDWMDGTIFFLTLFFLFVSLFQPYLETNLLAIFFWVMLGLARAQERRIIEKDRLQL